MTLARPARLALAAAVLSATVPALVFAGPPPKAKPPVKPGTPAAAPAPAPVEAASSGGLKDVEKAMTQKRYEAVLAYAKANPKAADDEEAWKTSIDLAKELEHWGPLVEHADAFLAAFPKSGDVLEVKLARASALGSLEKNDEAKAAFEAALKDVKPGEEGAGATTVFSGYQSYSTFLLETGDVPAAKKALDDVAALFKDDPRNGPAVRQIVEQQMKPMNLIGSEPPAITDTLKDMDGKEIKYEDYRGKVLLLDFWATWCHFCVEEMPNVVAAYKKWHDKGFEIVGVCHDQAGADKEVKAFMQKSGMTWRQYYDGQAGDNKLASLYEVNGIPATFLVGKDGKIVRVNLRGQALERALAKLLK
jgi:thiol-disulfide isomerase/thioredoxin